MNDDDLLSAPSWRRALPRVGLDETSDLPVPVLAVRLAAAGDRGPAAEAYREHLAEVPNDLDALERLAAIMKRLGREAEEVELHRRIAAISCAALGVPERDRDAVIAFELAAIGVEDPPATVPASYVSKSFDAMAGYFDHRLRTSLRYRGPEQLVERLARVHQVATRELEVCDVGCGTGLLGPLLRPYARALTGVDLSAKMLERAGERRVYDALVTAARALRDRGLFLFTAEDLSTADAAGDRGFELTLAGRYSHSEPYVRAVAAAAGFEVLSIEREPLRTERSRPVTALLCSLRR